MCGICGCVGRAEEEVVRAMAGSMAHRGPNGEGVRCFPSAAGSTPCALGHRRLSIIDPTPRGAQPMSFGDGRYWITYNGELYNYRELRREFEQGGMRFATETDTEVLLAMYQKHGPQMLECLNGMFAFAIWDAERDRLFLARDRLGIKPLYWTLRDKVLYFASEVKALLAVTPSPSLRPELLSTYLTLLWVPDPDTLFSGVYKLPPGHCATFESGRLRIEEYWDMTFEPKEREESEWAELVRDEVNEAVTRQMVSDVPLGSFLSGGLDSSAIVAAMKRTTPQVTTYTIGYSPEDLSHDVVPDDLKYARQMGRELGTDYHEEVLAPGVVDLLPKLVWHMDEPIADPACISTYLICASARESLTVILSGMGGDELFAGYPRHAAARLGHFADVLPTFARSGLRRLVESQMTMGGPGRMRGPRRNLMKLMRGIDAEPLERYLIYSSYYRQDEIERLLSPDLAGTAAHALDRHRDYAERVRGAHWLDQLLYVDLKTFLPCLNLAYTDKMSMAASTEVRVPLLDDDLVGLAGRIPADLKMKRLTRKYILKRSMQGTLPHEIIWRPKAGFGAPIRSWLTSDLKPMIGDLLSPDKVRARGLFDPKEVQRIVEANASGSEDNALRLWALLTLELWQQTYLDGSHLTSPLGCAA